MTREKALQVEQLLYNKLTQRATTEPPIYMSRLQFNDACYIPDEVKDRIVIVDFKEEADE